MGRLIVCVRCHNESDQADTCAECGRPARLDDRYELVGKLGHGASGFTWRARELREDREVAIKELSFRRLTDMKSFDLFQREAQVLEGLSHPGIPAYYDDTSLESDGQVSFFLIQELIDGEVLRPGNRWSEREILALLEELAEVLVYLSGENPVVMHRDIKPDNIMRRGDGRFVLIDFGSTRVALGDTVGGSTTAGTFGYMAPEQLRGVATPASDIYGLGATAVALLTGQDASQVIDLANPGSWRRLIQVDDGLLKLLEEMLNPRMEHRLDDPKLLLRNVHRLQGRIHDQRPPQLLEGFGKPAPRRQEESSGWIHTYLKTLTDVPMSIGIFSAVWTALLFVVLSGLRGIDRLPPMAQDASLAQLGVGLATAVLVAHVLLFGVAVLRHDGVVPSLAVLRNLVRVHLMGRGLVSVIQSFLTLVIFLFFWALLPFFVLPLVPEGSELRLLQLSLGLPVVVWLALQIYAHLPSTHPRRRWLKNLGQHFADEEDRQTLIDVAAQLRYRPASRLEPELLERLDGVYCSSSTADAIVHALRALYHARRGGPTRPVSQALSSVGDPSAQGSGVRRILREVMYSVVSRDPHLSRRIRDSL